jgi:hypothetical protein
VVVKKNDKQKLFDVSNVKIKERRMLWWFMMIMIFFWSQETEGYAYRLWGHWKLSVEDRSRSIPPQDISVRIFPREVQIMIRKEYVGGVITCQKELYGHYNLFSDVDTRQTFMNVHLENQMRTIDSILGVQVRFRKEEQKRVRGRLSAKVLYQSQDIIALEVSNRIQKCDQWSGKSYECLLSRVEASNGESTPVNFFLIGQFVGFVSSHTLDFTLSAIRHLIFQDGVSGTGGG